MGAFTRPRLQRSAPTPRRHAPQAVMRVRRCTSVRWLVVTASIVLLVIVCLAASAANVATVTLELYVPEFIDVLALLEDSGGVTGDDDQGFAGTLLTITTNQSNWMLLAGIESRALPVVVGTAVTEGTVALQIDVAYHDLRGSPSVAPTLTWRGGELRRSYTVVDKGGPGPFQQLWLAYRIDPAVLAALREMGPLRVVFTVVR